MSNFPWNADVFIGFCLGLIVGSLTCMLTVL